MGTPAGMPEAGGSIGSRLSPVNKIPGNLRNLLKRLFARLFKIGQMQGAQRFDRLTVTEAAF
jgi:hypothetical protein